MYKNFSTKIDAIIRTRRVLIIRKFSQRIYATARTRTWDNHVNSVALYQLSYGGSHPLVVGYI